MSAGARQRYRGSAPYGDSRLDRKTFFGRDRESRALLNLVLAERLVVLFARSGMGKTSLVNAGLIEPLRARRFFPAVARVSDTTAGPQVGVIEGVRQAALDAGVDCAGGDETSLSAFFASAEFWSPHEDLLRPVLILDQFEELFTLQSVERREELIGELRKLVRDGGALAAGPPRPKVVLSLREDFLANLEELAREIPGVLHNRFRLGPLERDGAREAILGPARVADDGFATAPFSYREEAVDRILNFLARQRRGEEMVATDEVEPVQLQLICQYLEEQVRLRQEGSAAGSGVEVSGADLKGEEHLRKVLKSFYERTLGGIKPRRKARSVRLLCEQVLVSSSGRRLPAAEEEIARRFDLPRDSLAELVDARLLRADVRLGSTFYELSHDTLIEPVVESRRERRRRKRTWLVVAGLAIAVVVLVVTAFWSARARAPFVVRMQLLPGSLGYLEAEVDAEMLARAKEYDALRESIEQRRVVRLGYRVSGGRFKQVRLWVRRGQFGRWEETEIMLRERRGEIDYRVGESAGSYAFDLVATSWTGGEPRPAGRNSPIEVAVPGAAAGRGEDAVDRKKEFTFAEWEKIKQELLATPGAYGLPERREGTLLVGTFNIRKLGAIDRRSEANWEFLGFICRRFDLLAVQEVTADTAGLEKLAELMGPAFDTLVSPASGGFGVRQGELSQAFLFNRERVEFTGRVGSVSRGSAEIRQMLDESIDELATAVREFAEQQRRYVRGEMSRRPSFRQPVLLDFMRPPFVADFRLLDRGSGPGVEMTAVNAHLIYGDRRAVTEAEFSELMAWIANRMRARQVENVLLLGNVNLRKHEDVAELIEPLTTTFNDAGVRVSFPFTARGYFPTTVRGQTYGYNQIGLFLRRETLPANWTDRGLHPKAGLEYGVFRFSDLFSRALTGRPLSALESGARRDLVRRFEFTLSDHLPQWTRLPVPAEEVSDETNGSGAP